MQKVDSFQIKKLFLIFNEIRVSILDGERYFIFKPNMRLEMLWAIYLFILHLFLPE